MHLRLTTTNCCLWLSLVIFATIYGHWSCLQLLCNLFFSILWGGQLLVWKSSKKTQLCAIVATMTIKSCNPMVIHFVICVPMYMYILWYKLSYKIVSSCIMVVSKLYVTHIYFTLKCSVFFSFAQGRLVDYTFWPYVAILANRLFIFPKVNWWLA